MCEDRWRALTDWQAIKGLLRLLALPGVGSRRLAGLLKALNDAGLSLAGCGRDEVRRIGGCAVPAECERSVATTLDDLNRQGVTVLVNDDSDGLPPALFARGELKLLRMSACGFSGSRVIVDPVADAVRAIAGAVAAAGLNVVSGGAKGVDQTAHQAVLDAGGATTVVIVEGILSWKTHDWLSQYRGRGQWLVVSQCWPNQSWNTPAAMARNDTICRLSQALLVGAAGLSGGGYRTGCMARRQSLPLFATRFPDATQTPAGNLRFLQQGGLPIRCDGAGRPKQEDIEHLIRACRYPTGRACQEWLPCVR